MVPTHVSLHGLRMRYSQRDPAHLLRAACMGLDIAQPHGEAESSEARPHPAATKQLPHACCLQLLAHAMRARSSAVAICICICMRLAGGIAGGSTTARSTATVHDVVMGGGE